MINYNNRLLEVRLTKYQTNNTTALVLKDPDDYNIYGIISINIEGVSEALKENQIIIPLYKTEGEVAELISSGVLYENNDSKEFQYNYGTYKIYNIDMDKVDGSLM